MSARKAHLAALTHPPMPMVNPRSSKFREVYSGISRSENRPRRYFSTSEIRETGIKANPGDRDGHACVHAPLGHGHDCDYYRFLASGSVLNSSFHLRKGC